MKVVQNEMVSMDWNADGFIETKKAGFISAVHSYGSVAVAFRDGKVYTHIDEDGNYNFDEMVRAIKAAHKQKDSDYPYFYDDYVEIYDGQEFAESNVEVLELGEYKEDILARLEDLSGYWMVVESDTP